MALCLEIRRHAGQRLRARWQADSEGAGGLRLDLTAHQDGRRVPYEYRIPVYRPIGQSRRGRSFLCPLVVDGSSCLRRCGVLYCPPNTGHFGCALKKRDVLGQPEVLGLIARFPLKPSEPTLLLSDPRSRLVCSELQREGAFVLLQLATKTNE
jgi:hypothetical protein